jgi:tRNA A-37 threonylcarbamoyl transferase component Bud32
VTLPRLVSYLLDVGKAVAFLHANGFLHLELHPGNVLVAPGS